MWPKQQQLNIFKEWDCLLFPVLCLQHEKNKLRDIPLNQFLQIRYYLSQWQFSEKKIPFLWVIKKQLCEILECMRLIRYLFVEIGTDSISSLFIGLTFALARRLSDWRLSVDPSDLCLVLSRGNKHKQTHL